MTANGRCWRAIAVCLLAPVWAEAQHWAFQSYGTEAGLINPTVLAVQQDTQGYLWVSTEGGLFRYDGDHFRQFEASLSGRIGAITGLHVSADGQLWAASAGVVFRWTGAEFVTVPGFTTLDLANDQALASDSTRLYVATTSGLWAFPLVGGSKPQQLTTAPVYSVFASRDKTVWFGCGSGLCSWRANRRVDSQSGSGARSGPWKSIAEDGSGRLWIRSAESVYVRGEDGRFRAAARFAAFHGSHLLATRRGEILAPHNGGLAICSVKGCRTYGLESGLQPSEVTAAGEDREGSLWVGYSGHGVARWIGREEWQSFTQTEGLTDSQVWRIVRGASGELWVGTNHGLFQGVQRAGRWRFSRCPLLQDWTVYGLLGDADGSLWLGTYQPGLNALVHYDPRTGRQDLYPAPSGTPKLHVSGLSRDQTGTIWVRQGKGLLRFEPGSARLKKVDLLPSDARVYDILKLGDARYFASRAGLYIERNGSVRLLTTADGLKENAIQSLAAGPEGEVWISYFGPAGISRLDWKSGQWQLRHLGTADGLPSNTVYSQFFDASGVHWLGTDSGAATLEGNHWVQRDAASGLVWSDCNAGAYLAEADGTVWIGTSAGLSRFVRTVQAAPPVPATLITSILRNDEAATGKVFGASTRSLLIRFTVLSYRQQHPLFRYRLGHTDPWMQTRTREVRFAQLPPGQYHFEVQGEVVPRTWSTPATFDFSIEPPWYLEVSFLAAASCPVAALCWFGWRAREKRERKVRATLEAAVAERTRSLAEATARAEEESRYKSQFLANMSHEMRTPLNGVLGLTRLALEVSNEPEVVQHLATVQVSAKLLLGLINDVLDLAKMEAGKLEIVPVAFAPRVFFAEVRSMLQEQARDKGLSLDLQVDDAVPDWIMADDCRLRQVLVNLIGNAIKFTHNGGVVVRVQQVAGQLECSVTDTGIGIELLQQQKIFEMFQQADASTSRQYGGSGLGLAISLKLIQSMGGSIEVDSEPGRGSTFSFRIKAPETCAPKVSGVASAGAPVRTMRILVAEDNKVNQQLLSALLRKRGHSVVLAANGREAVAAYRREALDLILMDIQMPGMDGMEAVRLIREAEAISGGRIPVVAVTARAMPGDRDEILAAGMDEYLDKPIKTERLDALLGYFAQAAPAQPDCQATETAGAGEPVPELCSSSKGSHARRGGSATASLDEPRTALVSRS